MLKETWDPHLRSTHDAIGHAIEATDGDIGHVGDFILDDDAWTIRYLIVDTWTWLPGRKVLIAPRWIKRISWNESKVFVDLLCDEVKHSPAIHEDELIMRNYEISLHEHYKRQGYWIKGRT